MKDCSFCGWKETKYTCTLCPNAVCNVCAKPVAEDEVGYDEKNYRVGKCLRGECKMGDVCLDTEKLLEAAGENDSAERSKEVSLKNEKFERKEGKQEKKLILL